eukprot:789989-Pelagomonas_calceolata.AAC.2
MLQTASSVLKPGLIIDAFRVVIIILEGALYRQQFETNKQCSRNGKNEQEEKPQPSSEVHTA